MEMTEKVLVESKKIIGIKCDCCGKVIYPAQKKKESILFDIEAEYYSITTGHCDWGNDSCDSVETKQVCSVECAQKIVDEYFKRSWGGVNSQYIEIEHKER